MNKPIRINAKRKAIAAVRVQIAEQIFASSKQLRPWILEARAAGNDALATELTRKYDELGRLATRVFNEQWPGEGDAR